jgi:hypothetical protein
MMMRLAAFSFVALGLAAGTAQAQGAGEAAASRPIVVELFTSQGCSSCPPADAYLGELAKRPNVLALGFHVDYWDYIGWKDPYASKVGTQRQRLYRRTFDLSYVYTPQMVVNGEAQAVGSERVDVESALKKVAARLPAGPSLSLDLAGDGGLVVHVGAGKPGSATVWLACFDREHTTAVTRGENAGSTLTNYRIVRHFESIGTWNGEALDLTVPAQEMSDYMKRPDQGVAVLVQSDEVGPILAAGVLSAKGR